MKLVLLLLSVSTLYAAFYFAQINGSHDLALQSVTSKALPGRDDPLRTFYTGIEPVDRLLTVLTVFFWPMTDGSTPTLTLHSLGFAGTFGSAWMLLTVESWRKGNAWTIAALYVGSFWKYGHVTDLCELNSPSIFGIFAQTLTFAFAAPLYAGLHLIFSSTASRPNAESIRAPRAVLNVIPYVFIIGYLVPSLLLIAPLSETITTDVKQIIIAAWQPWPLYISILTTVAHILFSPFVSSDKTIDGGRATLSSLRKVYAVAFANTAINHLIPWTISLFTILEPQFFKKEFLNALHPLNVFQLPLPWAQPALQISELGAGVHVFLRWDYVIGSTGVLLWALSLHRNAHRAILGKAGGLRLLIKVALLSVVASPVGAAVELMWERDELIVHETDGLKSRVPGSKKTS